MITGYSAFREFEPGQFVMLPATATIDVAQMEKAIVFVMARWAAASKISWHTLATALSGFKSLDGIVLYVADADNENTTRFLSEAGQFPSGAGDTFWILHGSITGKLHNYDDLKLATCEEFTRQLIDSPSRGAPVGVD